jgi:hypothetical protein
VQIAAVNHDVGGAVALLEFTSQGLARQFFSRYGVAEYQVLGLYADL